MMIAAPMMMMMLCGFEVARSLSLSLVSLSLTVFHLMINTLFFVLLVLSDSDGSAPNKAGEKEKPVAAARRGRRIKATPLERAAA